MKSSTIKVFGKVQNVGFRYYCKKKATQLKLFGFVKNQSDGSVYIEVQGSSDEVSIFTDWCKIGPSWSRVDRIIVIEQNQQSFNDFSIR